MKLSPAAERWLRTGKHRLLRGVHQVGADIEPWGTSDTVVR